MTVRYKNIGLYALLFSGLVILMHSFVHHDHHFDIVPQFYSAGHHHDTDSEKNDGESVHCYFLNDIIFHKNSIKIKNTFTGSLFTGTNYESPETYVFTDYLPFLFFVKESAIPLETAPVRGSPSA